MQIDPQEFLMNTYAPYPVTFVKGEGSWLWDDTGKRYLDLLSGIAVTSVGHCNPTVTKAITDQVGTLCHVSNLFKNQLAPQVAQMLNFLITGEPDLKGKTFFANSGAEAVESAIKLARRWGGGKRYKIITAHNSFHGRTFGALAATGQPVKQKNFYPMLAGFEYVEFGNIAQLEAACEDPEVAAVLLETWQGESGVICPSQDYIGQVRKLCDQKNILFMVDEIQTGLGRTGKWFGFQHFGVMPDVITLAKALGSGMPVGACWAKQEVADCFKPGDHATTFGGQPLAMSAVKATLEVMQDENVAEKAAQAGLYFYEKLQNINGIAHVRGKGLLVGIELQNQESAQVGRQLLQAGLVVNAVTPTALRLAPSLLITRQEIDLAIEIISQVLQADKVNAIS